MTKKQYLNELKNIVKRAKKEVSELTKDSKFKVFDYQPHYSVYGGKLVLPENTDGMDAVGIFLQAVDDYPKLPNLHPYTKEELENIKRNDADEKIKAYESSIKMHQDSINLYRDKIEIIKSSKK